MKTSELTGTALNSAVMSCEGLSKRLFGDINYSGDWYHGGQIIERERISLEYYAETNEWLAVIAKGFSVFRQWGNSPLVSAMRCYVASKLGDQIDIPTELMEGKQ
jgi:hypothetical protein